MSTGNISDIGSWKCGKGRAFTHIPTNFIILLKKRDLGITTNLRALRNRKKYSCWFQN